ncbi:hemerythrin domain-containing protein [Cytophagaceae bacterium ABcell3]|nr:hemerythrin domain-containing protein [Cytophagaceae bacterium ABcell3]
MKSILKPVIKQKRSRNVKKIGAIAAKKRDSFETVTEAVNYLVKKGYTYDFNIVAGQDCLVCQKKQLRLPSDDFQIDGFYRFEGVSDPGDAMIVFAVSSTKFGVKGIVVNAYGMYADAASSEIVEKLIKKAKEKQIKKDPIKRHQGLIHLSRDHHFGLLLVWKIRQGLKNKTEINRIIDYIFYVYNEDLKEHFEEEEFIFYKYFQNDELCGKAVKDHEQIHQQITALSTEDPSSLYDFAKLLEDHIRFEERILFNHIQQKLSEKELLCIEKAEEKKRTLDDAWPDHFWSY